MGQLVVSGVGCPEASDNVAVVLGGRVPYGEAWDWQRRLHASVVAGRSRGTVLLLEHDPVYTAGRRTESWERPGGSVRVIDVDRGGRITWHGPGQLTGYPIVPLTEPPNVAAHVRGLEEALMQVCVQLGVNATAIEGRPGVWCCGEDGAPARKIAAIGVSIRRGVTMHGFALNCDCDLRWFDEIVPCGIRGAGATSLSAELGRRVTVADAVPLVVEQLRRVLQA